jgi:hypothetical protein
MVTKARDVVTLTSVPDLVPPDPPLTTKEKVDPKEKAHNNEKRAIPIPVRLVPENLPIKNYLQQRSEKETKRC